LARWAALLAGASAAALALSVGFVLGGRKRM